MNDPTPDSADRLSQLVIALVIVAFIFAFFPGITQVFAVIGVSALLWTWGWLDEGPKEGP